jgi:PAS domain S-box-containing protein/putative nucleotidyltransferase with HDIG domain
LVGFERAAPAHIAVNMANPLAVMIVEDSESDALLLVRLLRKAGYEIVYQRVDTLEGMRAALEKQAWDLVISDYSLPNFDGPTALALLHERGPDIPFIVVSGTIGEETAVAMLKAGAHDYLVKGDLARLVPAVERELAQAKERRERRRAEEELKESEADYRYLFDSANDVILIFQPEEEIILEANASACDTYGFNHEELVGMSLKKLTKHAQKGEAHIKDMLAGRPQGNFESVHFNRRGEEIHFLINCSLIDYQGRKAILSINRDITERKLAEAALRDSEARYRSLFEDSPIALWEEDFSLVKQRLDTLREEGITDFEEYFRLHPEVADECVALVKVLDFNKAAIDLLGASNKDDLFKVLADRLKNQRKQELQRELINIGMGKTHFGWEGNNRTLDGRLIDIDLNWSAVPGYETSLSRVIVSMADITERKQAEEALQASEDKFKYIFDYSVVGKSITLPSGAVHVNRSFCDMLGYSPEELQNKRWQDITHPADIELTQREIGALLSGEKQAARFTKRYLKKDGSVVWTDASTSLRRDKQGKPLYFMTTLIDITERKRAEATMQHTTELLSEALDIARLANWEYDVEKDTFLFNDHFYSIFHTTAEREGGYKMSSAQYAQRLVDPDDAPVVGAAIERALASTDRHYSTQLEHRILYRGGGIGYISVIIHIDRDEQGRIIRYYGVNQDITERKLAEETSTHLAAIVEASDDAIIGNTLNGIITSWNSGAERLYGYSQEEVIGQPVSLLFPPDRLDELPEILSRIRRGESVEHYGTMRLRKDGVRLDVSLTVSPIKDASGQIVGASSIGRDITSRKQAEQALQASEARYKSLFEDSPISLWEEDFSAVKQRLNAWSEEGITNFQEHFKSHPEAVAELAALIRVVDVNKATIKMFRADHKQELIKNLADLLDIRGYLEFQEEFVSIAEGKTQFSWEGMNKTIDGRLIDIDLNFSAAPGYEKSLSKVIISMINITERKRAEAALAKSEQDYRTLFENMPIGLYRTSADGHLLDANQAMVEMFGYKDREALLASKIIDLYVDPASDRKFKTEIEKTGVVSNFEAEVKRADGTTFWAEDHNHIVRDEKGNPLFYEGSLIDITERKRSATALQQAKDFAEKVIQTANVIFIQLDTAGNIQKFNSAAEEITGYSLSEVVGTNWGDKLVPRERYPKVWQELERLAIRGETPVGFENPILTKHGEEHDVLWKNNILYEGDKVVGLISFGIDISERKQAEKRIRQQLERLAALRNIDQVITSSFDLPNSLTIILNQVTKELGVDAADVLLLNSTNLFLEYSAGVGFRTKAAEKASVRLGQSYAGRVALERQLIQIQNLKDQPDDPLLSTYLAGEGFVYYVGVPLVAKGSVKGVLEVYHRTFLKPDQEWLDFLSTLAGQAALAIDNAHLFENMQRSNIELTLAYDATIEGWSQAMDLRDKETEGHTLRVTEMTVELAGLFGIKDEDLVNIRRGALLHDIGKMGIPDAILLKPDKLTDEEWVIMRKHPMLAFELLSSIRYLQSALDIPYCHHEKWDGSGYPRGLKGEQIPLQARIFAVVDVWDALTSDRPYRKAWSKEKTMEYLRSQSGRHFDPQVLQVCLQSGVFDRKSQK